MLEGSHEMVSTMVKKVKKKPGAKPRGGPGEMVMVRLHEPLLGMLDRWCASQLDNPTRPEAIRRMMIHILGAPGGYAPLAQAAPPPVYRPPSAPLPPEPETEEDREYEPVVRSMSRGEPERNFLAELKETAPELYARLRAQIAAEPPPRSRSEEARRLKKTRERPK
jgi:hypothetical protein